MDELNDRGKGFVHKWCDEKHTTTQRIPNHHYLLEEKAALQPLPTTRYRTCQMHKRIISPDSFVNIQSNKYSVPVQYVGKTVLFRLAYGFRIELYDTKECFIMGFEASGKKHGTYASPEHYEAIAPRVSTSIPQIRRDFTGRYSNGYRYLEAAGRKFDQPTRYARKIMELQELYDEQVMDYLIGVAVDEDRMDIKSFRALLREYNTGMRVLAGKEKPGTLPARAQGDDPALTRDCSYYEDYAREVCCANGISR